MNEAGRTGDADRAPSPFAGRGASAVRFLVSMVRVPEQEGLLLRRPYSFCDAEKEGGRFSLLVKEVGRGTRALARLSVGDAVDCLGPLGTAFRMPRAGRKPVMVAGGVGIAPFVAFCRELANSGRQGTVLLGGRPAHDHVRHQRGLRPWPQLRQRARRGRRRRFCILFFKGCNRLFVFCFQ